MMATPKTTSKTTSTPSLKPIVLIKLGGSIITDKSRENTMNFRVLRDLIRQIGQAREFFQHEMHDNPDHEMRFLIGHGQGSYAHIPAKKYGTMHGYTDSLGRLGAAITQDKAQEANRIVVREMLNQELPAMSWYMNNTILTKNRKPVEVFLEVLVEYLQRGIIPVTGGDVLADLKMNSTIWSTEEGLSHLALALKKRGFKVLRIIHATETDGFLDQKKNCIPTITPKNWPTVQSALYTTKGLADVTGGMQLKVEESLALAKRGIESYLISGLKKNNLYHAILDQEWMGTRVTNESLDE